MTRQRSIAELEGHVLRLLDDLPCVRSEQAEAGARLAELRRELADLDGS